MEMWLGVALAVSAWMVVARLAPGGGFRKNLMGFCGAVASIVVLVVIVGEAPAPKAPIITTAGDMFNEYAKDEEAAERKYHASQVVITGSVRTIENHDGDVAVRLEGPTEHASVLIYVSDGFSVEATTLQRGQSASFTCIGGTVVAGSPSLQACAKI